MHHLFYSPSQVPGLRPPKQRKKKVIRRQHDDSDEPSQADRIQAELDERERRLAERERMLAEKERQLERQAQRGSPATTPPRSNQQPRSRSTPTVPNEPQGATQNRVTQVTVYSAPSRRH